MNWIKNILLVCISTLLAFSLFEIGLRIDGRYEDQASHKVGGSETIWTREKNSIEYYSHPDLKREIEIIFDQYSARVSSPNEADNKRKIAFFGDSSTENRRVENKYSFIEVLNEQSNSAQFYNFGVDGFGLEQSYSQYLSKRNLMKFDKVFYVFYHNDLRNTYEVQLFDKSSMRNGIVNRNPNATSVPWYIQFVSKLHVTYLAIEGYYKFFYTVKMQTESFSNRLGQKFSQGRREQDQRSHDVYADSILQRVISLNPNDEDKIIIDHFKNTLKKWKLDVEAGGADFYVLILPLEPAVKLASILDLENQFQLSHNSDFPLLQNRSWKFVNDGHWNEYGNLVAAISIINDAGQFGMEDDFVNFDESFFSTRIKEIDLLYLSGSN